MAKLAALELIQLEQEGRDTTAARRKAEGPFAEFWEAAAAAPMLPESDYPFVEPTEWDEIVAVCPSLKDGPEALPPMPFLDLLDEYGSEWEWGELEDIINYRYRERMFTVMTTNRDLTELPERVVSRFRDPDIGVVVLNSGKDYRRR